MHAKRLLVDIVLALGLLPATSALAADIEELPPAQMQNGITYVTGGFGSDESSAMKAAAHNYDLMLTFALRGGSYLADVKVTVVDSDGNTVLDTLSGPILLANLPHGRYKVWAEMNGVSRSQVVDVTGRRRGQLVFAWPDDIEGRSGFIPYEARRWEQ